MLIQVKLGTCDISRHMSLCVVNELPSIYQIKHRTSRMLQSIIQLYNINIPQMLAPLATVYLEDKIIECWVAQLHSYDVQVNTIEYSNPYAVQEIIEFITSIK